MFPCTTTKKSTILWKSGNLYLHALVSQKIGTYKSNYFVSFIKNVHVYKMDMYTIPGICKKICLNLLMHEMYEHVMCVLNLSFILVVNATKH